MRILVAFDKFKDALGAGAACDAAARALRETLPGARLDLCPLADGGDGFESVLGSALQGSSVECTVTGPRGAWVRAGFNLVPATALPAGVRARLPNARKNGAPGSVAVVEMARASGLQLLRPEERDPWETTSYGTGQLIRAAAEAGAAAVILGIGGSATNDLGLGALAALGLEFRDAAGGKIRPPVPRQWARVDRIEGAVFDSIPPLLIASDVNHPLLGSRGATRTFAPQKGLRPQTMNEMEDAFARMAALLLEHTGKPPSLAETPGAGAAGGTAFGLLCGARARLMSGMHLVADCLQLENRVREADLVISGEGRFDSTSLEGKATGELVRLARVAGKAVHLVVGTSAFADGTLDGLRIHPLSTEGPASSTQLARTGQQLAAEVARLAASIRGLPPSHCD